LSAHTTTAASQSVPKNQIKHSNGPGPFPPIYAPDPRSAEERQAKSKSAVLRGNQWDVIGADEPPVFHGVTGTGELPFFHGVTGTGDEPFAIIKVPSPCAVTTVFRPIAPTKTSMARNTTASFLDMLPPGMNDTQRHSIPIYRDVK
jgi:hypothetical protein